MRKEIKENYQVVDKEVMGKGEMVEVISRNQSIKIQSRDENPHEMEMLSLEMMKRSREPDEKVEGWIYDEKEINDLQEKILKGELVGSILKVHKWVEGNGIAVVKAMTSPMMTVSRPKNPSPEMSPLDFIHSIHCESIKVENQADDEVCKDGKLCWSAICPFRHPEREKGERPTTPSGNTKRKRSPSPEKETKKGDAHGISGIFIDVTGYSVDDDVDEDEEGDEEIVRLEVGDSPSDAVARSEADQSESDAPTDQFSQMNLEGEIPAKLEVKTAEEQQMLNIRAENYRLKGEAQKKERELFCLGNKLRRMQWELNLRLPANKWRLQREKWPKIPIQEMRPEILGIPDTMIEQHEWLQKACKDQLAGKAMIAGAVREVGESYKEAVLRLGPKGLSERRTDIRLKTEKAWKNLVPKTYDQVKDEVLEEAKAEADHFRFRAERINQRNKERFQPFEWWYAPSFGDFEETEAEIANRIRSTRDGTFQPGITSFGEKTG